VISAIGGESICTNMVRTVGGNAVGTNVIRTIGGNTVGAYVVCTITGKATDVGVRRTVFGNYGCMGIVVRIHDGKRESASCQDRESKAENEFVSVDIGFHDSDSRSI